MIATLVNCATVIIGSLLGLLLHRRINEAFKRIVYVGAGLVFLVLGGKMSFTNAPDGFMAIMLTAALGIGVAFSALTILVYQGGITLLARWIQPYVNPLMLGEL